jgi:hypothetical protein
VLKTGGIALIPLHNLQKKKAIHYLASQNPLTTHPPLFNQTVPDLYLH